MFEPIQLGSVIEESVTRPIMDGTRGSGLYTIPVRLSRTPPLDWQKVFVEAWNHPQSWTTRHRRGIAIVAGDAVHLKGSTLRELEKYHLATLLAAVRFANRCSGYIESQADAASEQKQLQEHQENVRMVIDRLSLE